MFWGRHVVHPGLGVYNLMRCLERSLVGIVQLLQVMLDARIDICPALGLHMRRQVKLGLQSYTTKQRQRPRPSALPRPGAKKGSASATP
ncbi:hypothetical protein Tco_0094002 [Tanacetum coccineum]